MTDLFIEPAKALIKGSQEFGRGIAKGTSSFVRKSIYGTMSTAKSLGSTIATGFAAASGDPEW